MLRTPRLLLSLFVLWLADTMLFPRQWCVHHNDEMCGWFGDLHRWHRSHPFELSGAVRRGRVGPVEHTARVFDSERVRWRAGEHPKMSGENIVC